MLKALIRSALDRPWLVAMGVAALVIAGVQAMLTIPVDAFPDLTNNQVTIVTSAPGMAAVEVEQLVTFPIESAVMGLPNTLETRSISKLSLSMITVVFEDGVDTYLARQLINERLAEARERIPEGLQPQLGPVATPFGEVYQYTLEGEGYTPMELKTLHDWQIKYQLRAVPGVADVNTWGGFTRRYEIVADPRKLRSYGLELRGIFRRVSENNANFSGGFVEHASEQYTVRGLGRARTRAELGAIVVAAHQGAPVYLRDVAEIRVGAAPRQGAVTAGGRGETLSGMVIMLKGQNSKTVIERVKAAIERMKPSLPQGVALAPFYDQSEVIDGTIATVRNNLLLGGGLVIVVLFIALRNLRAAVMVALVVPLSMLAAFLGMSLLGVTANLMSLGAVDFGVVVEGAVVMVDNCVRRLQERRQNASAESHLETVRGAAEEMGTPILAGMAILISVYIPILGLEGLEGRMFRPMAVTVCSAVAGGLLLALFALPSGCRYLLRGRIIEQRDPMFDPLRRFYGQVLQRVLNNRGRVIAAAAAVIAAAVGSLPFLGTEFMPRMDEGSILIQTLRLPSVSVSESVDLQLKVERVVRQFPEVTRVVSKLGRPDFATEAMGVYEADLYVNLKPQSEWTTASTKEGLIDAMARELSHVPGVVCNFTQPMAMRLDEAVTGVKADVAVKIFGDDEEALERKADEIVQLVRRVPGAADVRREVFSGAAEWQVDIDRGELARYGLNVSDVRDLIEAAVAGKPVTEVIDGRRRFQVVVRLPEQYRRHRDDLGGLLLQAPGGEWVPLSEVAEIRRAVTPEVVQREDSQRRLVVLSNVRGRDLGSFVEEARELVAARVDLPPGYFVRWGGQFEHQERAMKRLSLLAPAVLAVIFAVLYSTFGSFKQATLVFTLVPFAAVGGIGALWLRGMNLNVSASIGFIAVFGIAITDGLVMVSTINRLLDRGAAMREALVEGARTRLRPVLMTSMVAALGFLPMAAATSTGAEVQRPLATVVIGGVISATFLTLLVTPALFPLTIRGGSAALARPARNPDAAPQA